MTSTRSFSRSNGDTEALSRLVPGGAHTLAKGEDQYPEHLAPVIERGRGCRAWDVDGNEYVEYGIGLRSVTLGHAYEPVLEAVRSAMARGVNFVRPTHDERVAAETIVDLVPSAEMVKFGLNGSDATSAAVRLARAYTGRDLVLVCADQPMFSKDDWFIATTPMSAGIPDATRDLTRTFPYNDADGLAAVLATHGDQVAAVVLEAETSQAPVPGFLRSVRELCDRHGALLILDEIITGFRRHLQGAQKVYDIAPDLCAFGKGIANGLPLSFLAGRREIMRLGGFVEDADRVCVLSQTGGAQPWALQAMLEVIRTYREDDIADRLHSIGRSLRTAIDREIARADLTEHIELRGRDCNLVYVTRDRQGQPSQIFRTILLQELIGRGVLAPSLVVSAAHDPTAVERTVAAFGESFEVYRRALDDGPDTVLRGRPVRPAMRRRG